MKINIIIPNLESNILNLENFEYSLGFIEIIVGKTTISLFNNKKCMIFLTISELFSILDDLKNNNKLKTKWVGEDNGYFFMISLVENYINFEGNDFNFKFDFNRFKIMIINAIKRSIKEFIKLNPKIENENFFLEFKNLISKK